MIIEEKNLICCFWFLVLDIDMDLCKNTWQLFKSLYKTMNRIEKLLFQFIRAQSIFRTSDDDNNNLCFLEVLLFYFCIISNNCIVYINIPVYPFCLCFEHSYKQTINSSIHKYILKIKFENIIHFTM